MDLAGGLIVLVVFLLCYAVDAKRRLKAAQTTVAGLATTRVRLAELEGERAQLSAQVARLGTLRGQLDEHAVAYHGEDDGREDDGREEDGREGGAEETSAFADWLGAAPLAAYEIARELEAAEQARDELGVERDQLSDRVAALQAGAGRSKPGSRRLRRRSRRQSAAVTC